MELKQTRRFKMAGIDRVNGAPSAEAFYGGYQPLVIKVENNGVFTANTGGGTTAIVEGGYAKAVKALQTVGSIVWLGTQTANSFTAVVDGATVNRGAGATTAGTWGALKDALASEVGGAAGDFTVTSSNALNGAGTFTFA